MVAIRISFQSRKRPLDMIEFSCEDTRSIDELIRLEEKKFTQPYTVLCIEPERASDLRTEEQSQRAGGPLGERRDESLQSIDAQCRQSTAESESKGINS